MTGAIDLAAYYRIRGWDADGVPKAKKLRALDLEAVKLDAAIA